MTDKVSNPSNTVGFVNLDDLNESEKVTTVSLGLMKDAVKAADVLSHGSHWGSTHVHIVESDDDGNPAVAFSTDRSGTTAVMVASQTDDDA